MFAQRTRICRIFRSMTQNGLSYSLSRAIISVLPDIELIVFASGSSSRISMFSSIGSSSIGSIVRIGVSPTQGKSNLSFPDFLPMTFQSLLIILSSLALWWHVWCKKKINVYPSAAVFFVFVAFLRLSCGNSGISSNLLKSTELKNQNYFNNQVKMRLE